MCVRERMWLRVCKIVREVVLYFYFMDIRSSVIGSSSSSNSFQIQTKFFLELKCAARSSVENLDLDCEI